MKSGLIAEADFLRFLVVFILKKITSIRIHVENRSRFICINGIRARFT